MANDPERDWEIFKSYGVHGVRIEQGEDYITLSRRDSYNRKGIRAFRNILIGIWVAAALFAVAAIHPWAGLYALVLLPIPLLLIFLLGMLFFRSRAILRITEEGLDIKEGGYWYKVPFNEIRGIDVRGSSMSSEIFVWHGATGIRVFGELRHDDALSLHQGIDTAIKLASGGIGQVLPVEAPSSPPAQPAAPRPPRNAFPE